MKEFELPNGLEIDGTLYRRGKVRGLTMEDEIDIAGDPRAKKNPAWRLPITMARAITEFEDLPVPVDLNKVVKLRRADYIYLTNRIAEATDEGLSLEATCPHCGQTHEVAIDSLISAAPLA